MNDFAVIDYKGSINGKTVGEVLPSAPATLAQKQRVLVAHGRRQLPSRFLRRSCRRKGRGHQGYLGDYSR